VENLEEDSAKYRRQVVNRRMIHLLFAHGRIPQLRAMTHTSNIARQALRAE
jgi:hypothetical protein